MLWYPCKVAVALWVHMGGIVLLHAMKKEWRCGFKTAAIVYGVSLAGLFTAGVFALLELRKNDAYELYSWKFIVGLSLEVACVLWIVIAFLLYCCKNSTLSTSAVWANDEPVWRPTNRRDPSMPSPSPPPQPNLPTLPQLPAVAPIPEPSPTPGRNRLPPLQPRSPPRSSDGKRDTRRSVSPLRSCS